MAYLEIKNLYKKFGDVEVLKGVDLDLNKGEVLSIIGPSGGGKSTLLRSINFLETPDLGTMTLDGEMLFDAHLAKAYGDSELRDKRLNFGLVFQSFNLFPQYNVLDNITLAPKLLLNDKIKAYKKQLRKEKVSFFEIKRKVFEYKQKEIVEIEKHGLELLEKIGLTDKI